MVWSPYKNLSLVSCPSSFGISPEKLQPTRILRRSRRANKSRNNPGSENIEISGQLELLKRVWLRTGFRGYSGFRWTQEEDRPSPCCRRNPCQKNKKNRRQSPHMLETNAKNSNSCACMETQIKSNQTVKVEMFHTRSAIRTGTGCRLKGTLTIRNSRVFCRSRHHETTTTTTAE